MKRTPLRRVGRIGRANIEANKKLREVLAGINSCEMKLRGCTETWPLQRAHRHKRSWYKGDIAKLSDYKQVVIACQWCHEMTEYNRPLNDKVFLRLRGPE